MGKCSYQARNKSLRVLSKSISIFICVHGLFFRVSLSQQLAGRAQHIQDIVRCNLLRIKQEGGGGGGEYAHFAHRTHTISNLRDFIERYSQLFQFICGAHGERTLSSLVRIVIRLTLGAAPHLAVVVSF